MDIMSRFSTSLFKDNDEHDVKIFMLYRLANECKDALNVIKTYKELLNNESIKFYDYAHNFINFCNHYIELYNNDIIPNLEETWVRIRPKKWENTILGSVLNASRSPKITNDIYFISKIYHDTLNISSETNVNDIIKETIIN